MFYFLKTKFNKIYEDLTNYLRSKKKINILITNLSLSDRIHISDLINKEDGVNASYKLEEGCTTKFSEMVSTKSYKFIFYKQQYFMENSIENFLNFSNDSKIKLSKIEGIIFMINLKNIKSLKFGAFELESLLELYKELPVKIKIVLFNGPKNSLIDQKEIDHFLNLKENRLRYFQDLSCYLCDFTDSYKDLMIVVEGLFYDKMNEEESNPQIDTEGKLDNSENKILK